jgi:hypothetical protein
MERNYAVKCEPARFCMGVCSLSRFPFVFHLSTTKSGAREPSRECHFVLTCRLPDHANYQMFHPRHEVFHHHINICLSCGAGNWDDCQRSHASKTKLSYRESTITRKLVVTRKKYVILVINQRMLYQLVRDSCFTTTSESRDSKVCRQARSATVF